MHMHVYKSSSDGISLNHLSLTFLLTSPRHHVKNVASQKGARIEESFFANTRLEYQRFNLLLTCAIVCILATIRILRATPPV